MLSRSLADRNTIQLRLFTPCICCFLLDDAKYRRFVHATFLLKPGALDVDFEESSIWIYLGSSCCTGDSLMNDY